MIDISSLIQRTIDVSTQLARMATSIDGDDQLPRSCERVDGKGAAMGVGKGGGGRATSTQSVGAEFYFKDVLFTQETPEFIL